MFDKSLPMTGFEPQISGIGGDRSTNWTTPLPYFDYLQNDPPFSDYLQKLHKKDKKVTPMCFTKKCFEHLQNDPSFSDYPMASTAADETTNAISRMTLTQIPEDAITASKMEPTSPRTLDVIDEDRVSGDESVGSEQLKQQHRSKRANMVKKALTYFSDKSNRSVSEDNLFTR